MSTQTQSTPAERPAGELTTDLCRQIAALPRDTKQALLIFLQEDLDGGPFIGDLPEQPADPSADVADAWRTEIARRVEDMRAGRVEAIDAQGAAARLLQRTLRRHAP